MAIVINSIPDGQVLDVKYGNARNLSMNVSGLDATHPDQVTASLGGYKMSEFLSPPGVAQVGPPQTTPPGSLLVILTLVGSVALLLGPKPLVPARPDQKLDGFTDELTVTITQGQLSSSPMAVHAYYLNEPSLLDGSGTS